LQAARHQFESLKRRRIPWEYPASLASNSKRAVCLSGINSILLPLLGRTPNLRLAFGFGEQETPTEYGGEPSALSCIVLVRSNNL
jgi:hypothetical protein